MKIVIVGTSNSVMGGKGYVQALQLEHDVVQLSKGRTPFYSAMKTIMDNKDEIESADLLIIDHYVNDVNFYGDRFGESYREHLDLFYSYLSSLNVNILNLMFPIRDLQHRSSIDIYHRTKALCDKYSISILDLNEIDIPEEYYRDSIHLTHDVSFALGISLNQGLSKHTFDSVYLGSVSEFPFYGLSASDLSHSGNEVGVFENSLVSVEYLKLEKELKIRKPNSHRLIAVGLVRDKKISGCSGFLLNCEETAISGSGYFIETIEKNVDGDIIICPLDGYREIRNMMGRGVSKGLFTYCYISDLLFIDLNKKVNLTSAERKVYNIDINSFISLAERLLLIGAEKVPYPKISPKSVDRLRDVALSLYKEDLLIARDFMKLAHLARPNGPLIKKKLAEYEEALNSRS